MDLMVYVGTDTTLRGELALVRKDPYLPDRFVMAQFNNREMPEAFCWGVYYPDEFEKVNPVDYGLEGKFWCWHFFRTDTGGMGDAWTCQKCGLSRYPEGLWFKPVFRWFKRTA